jgi:hypothetical protein
MAGAKITFVLLLAGYVFLSPIAIRQGLRLAEARCARAAHTQLSAFLAGQDYHEIVFLETSGTLW